jgi:lipid-A-disaccharide synthase
LLKDLPINRPSGNKNRKVMIVAGEASGDLHGAHLVEAMRSLEPDLDFFGIGGDALRKAGVEVRVESSGIAVVGGAEVLSKIRPIFRALRLAKKDLKQLRPALLILIDFPDFNLRVAAAAKKMGIPVMYYISPQIWAWRAGRVKKIKKLVDHMVVIFPFEVPFYKKWDVPVTFVGHPLLDSTPPAGMRKTSEDLRGDGVLVGLLAGSRSQEVTRMLPTMVAVAESLSRQVKGIRFAVPVASSVGRELVEGIVRGAEAEIAVVSDRLRDVLDEATLVITASGTVTLEAAIAGTPMIIVYRLSPLSYWIAKRLIHVEHIGLVNLVGEASIVPELIQHDASVENISDQALAMIRDEHRLAQMRGALHRVAEKLGVPGASERAAKVAVGMLS